MDSIMDLCFLCTKNYDCVPIHEIIVSQVEYLLPEISIIKLGVPLRICSACDGALCAFSKFKQSCVESSQRLEASIKRALGPPLHTGSPPVVNDSKSSVDKPEKMEAIFIKEEYLEEIPLDIQMQTDRASLNPIVLLERISAEPQNKNLQLHTYTNADNTEEITIKEEPMEETRQDRLYYKKILNGEYVSDSTKDDKYNQSEHNTEDESATFNTSLHMKIHTGVKDFQCGFCNTSFTRKDYLNRHIKIHSAMKDFKCGVCDKSFTQKSSLNLHMIIHSEVKDFQCGVCNKSFTLKNTLNLHMKIHTGVKDFQCSVCNKSFTQKSSLNLHMKIHSGVKDFQCSVCNKSFTLKNSFNLHMKIHSGVKDFQCGVCNKSFRQKSTLNTHMKIHSGVNSV